MTLAAGSETDQRAATTEPLSVSSAPCVCVRRPLWPTLSARLRDHGADADETMAAESRFAPECRTNTDYIQDPWRRWLDALASASSSFNVR